MKQIYYAIESKCKSNPSLNYIVKSSYANIKSLKENCKELIKVKHKNTVAMFAKNMHGKELYLSRYVLTDYKGSTVDYDQYYVINEVGYDFFSDITNVLNNYSTFSPKKMEKKWEQPINIINGKAKKPLNLASSQKIWIYTSSNKFRECEELFIELALNLKDYNSLNFICSQKRICDFPNITNHIELDFDTLHKQVSDIGIGKINQIFIDDKSEVNQKANNDYEEYDDRKSDYNGESQYIKAQNDLVIEKDKHMEQNNKLKESFMEKEHNSQFKSNNNEVIEKISESNEVDINEIDIEFALLSHDERGQGTWCMSIFYKSYEKYFKNFYGMPKILMQSNAVSFFSKHVDENIFISKSFSEGYDKHGRPIATQQHCVFKSGYDLSNDINSLFLPESVLDPVIYISTNEPKPLQKQNLKTHNPSKIIKNYKIDSNFWIKSQNYAKIQIELIKIAHYLSNNSFCHIYISKDTYLSDIKKIEPDLSSYFEITEKDLMVMIQFMDNGIFSNVKDFFSLSDQAKSNALESIKANQASKEYFRLYESIVNKNIPYSEKYINKIISILKNRLSELINLFGTKKKYHEDILEVNQNIQNEIYMINDHKLHIYYHLFLDFHLLCFDAENYGIEDLYLKYDNKIKNINIEEKYFFDNFFSLLKEKSNNKSFVSFLNIFYCFIVLTFFDENKNINRKILQVYDDGLYISTKNKLL